jgi:anti-sigma factor RsiW
MIMECTQSRSRLHPYLDHELDAAGMLEIERHLGGCAACRALFAGHAALQAGTRQNAQYFRAPAGLAGRIRARIDPAPARRAFASFGQRWHPGRWLPLGAAIAATALVTWTAAIQYAALSPDETVAEQVINGHARSIVSARLVDVASSDHHTVKPWLSSKLDFSPPVTDLVGAGFPLVGGRLDYVDKRTVATLVYRHREHVIDLFIWPDAAARAQREPQELSRNGYNILHWSEGGMAFWAISDLNAFELKTFAEAYASAK